jgi:hypothetical protein
MIEFLRLVWRRAILYNKFLLSVLAIYNRIFRPVESIALIVWPPANHLADQIRGRVNELCELEKHIRISISENEIESVIREVYQVDFASTSKIKYKIERIVEHDPILNIFLVRFLHPRREVQDIFNRTRCLDVHSVKGTIRSEFKDLVDNYIFDIVIHSTEKTSETNTVLQVLSRHGVFEYVGDSETSI